MRKDKIMKSYYSRFASILASASLLVGMSIAPIAKTTADTTKVESGQNGYLENHVFLTGGIDAVDVTATIFKSHGHTYCIYNGEQIRIHIHWHQCIVRGDHGDIIGYTAWVDV